MKNLSVGRGISLGMVMMLVATVSISAQMDQKIAQSRQQNAESLRQFTWKSRTEIQRGGETRSVKVAQMRYATDGSVQKTPISSTPEPQLPTKGLRGLIAQKKKGDFIETLENLGRLARSYSELPPEKMQSFMSNATMTPEMDSAQKLIRIHGRGVIQPGDSMTLWVDAATRRMRRIEIQTALEKDLVTVVSDFQDLPKGPSYMARSVVSYPSDEIKIITENFDYEPIKP